MVTLSAKTFLQLALSIAAFLLPVVVRAEGADRKPLECTVIFDLDSGAVILRNGVCDRRFTPMSSFKVPLAVMGFDAGTLEDAHNPRWNYDPRFDAPARARKAVDPTVWQADSIVWYSQELTRMLGRTAFENYLEKLGYGNRDGRGLNGQGDGLTHAWLSSSLEVSADEQAAFMRRLARRELAVSRLAQDQALAIIPRFAAAKGWAVWGKTGSGSLRGRDDRLDRTRPVGWFVGWAEKPGARIAFARLRIGTQKPSEPPGLALRALFLAELPTLLPSP